MTWNQGPGKTHINNISVYELNSLKTFPTKKFLRENRISYVSIANVFQKLQH